MIDAIIILTLILVGATVGYQSVELLPFDILSQVANIEGLRWVTLGFGSLIGVGVGLVVQTTYRRLERGVKKLPTEV